MKAHQRLVRERVADKTDLLGRWWDGIDTDISKAEVKEISHAMARGIIEEYEWMGCLAAVNWHYYGIFFGGMCAGAVVYGPEYSENLGIQARESGRKCADWSKYGYEGKMILLSRGACVHWAHPHSASKLIRGSMQLLPEKYKIVTATVDILAGEIGTIYQACGFDYVGSMRDSNRNVNSRSMDRDGWLINGKLYGSRAVRMKVGTTNIEDIRRYYPDAEKVKQQSKGRYFAFRGSKTEKKNNRKAIAHLIKPYPKRQEQP